MVCAVLLLPKLVYGGHGSGALLPQPETGPSEWIRGASLCYLSNIPPCSTCQKAKKWLDEHNVSYTDRHIKEQKPTYEELTAWYKKSGLPLKKFFNTSGLLYKSLTLKEKLPTMTEEEQLRLLSTDGMLVKRPILVTENAVLVGFQEAQWKTLL